MTILRLLIGLPCLFLWGTILMYNCWPFFQLVSPRLRNKHVSGVPVVGSVCGFLIVLMIGNDNLGRHVWVWLLAFLPDVVEVPQIMYALFVRPILKKKR